MRDLNVNQLMDKTDENKISEFIDQIDSSMRVQTDYSKDDLDTEWIDMFEFTLPYLDKICRNPKRFIQNEEEIIKIEQAKKVGVETVKHLAKHTNFVQDIDEKTGDVIPSKLLNVLKEETFNTYENRFIYTLIQYMLQLIKLKQDNEVEEPRLKDNKKIDYTSTTNVGDEKISVNVSLKTMLDTSINKDENLNNRIKKIEEDTKALQFSEVYRALEKEGVPLVQNPIKKTNVILKNVNFQYAMKLWDFIMKQFSNKENKKKQEKKDYFAEAKLKGLIDETFLLQYLTVNSINNEDRKDVIEDAKERTISRMLDKIIDMNPELTKKQLQDKLGNQYDRIKTIRVLSKKDIEKIFRKHIDKYFENISNVEI